MLMTAVATLIFVAVLYFDRAFFFWLIVHGNHCWLRKQPERHTQWHVSDLCRKIYHENGGFYGADNWSLRHFECRDVDLSLSG